MIPGYSLILLLLFALFSPSSAQINCANAPTPGIRQICQQILTWDSTARTRPLVAPAPGPSVGAGPQAAATNTYECLNITCICQLSGGFGGENCRLPNGQLYTRVQRKEIRAMTDAERSRYAAAMWAIKQNGEYNALTAIHSNVQVSPGAHSGPAFAPWHREFLKRLEISLRRIDPTVFIPYWDSRLDYRIPNPADSVLWHNDLYGYESADGQVRTGIFANWPYIDNSRFYRRNRGASGSLLSPTEVNTVLAQTDFQQVLANTAPRQGCPNPAQWYVLEYVHGNPHIWIGGDMLSIPTSTNDPIFYSHHAFIDYIWENWRVSRQNRAQREALYPPDNINCHSQVHNGGATMQPFNSFVNRDGLSNMYTDSLFFYQNTPLCSAANPNGCGSRFLFCDLSHGQPACASKIIIGGNCQGYSFNEDRCYLGVCVNGRCVAGTVTTTTTTTTQAPSTNCFNEQVCCATWASQGYCQSNPAYMNVWCRTACGVCTPNYNPNIQCSDRSPSCPAWAARGECTANPAWMRENCRISCGYCGTTRAQDCLGGTATTTTTTTQAPTTTCLNNNFCCPIYARTYCNVASWRSYMLQNCGASCGFCTPPPNLNGPQCVNFHPSCQAWAASGYCSSGSYRSYMLENCKVSCGSCSYLNINTRQAACAGTFRSALSRLASGRGSIPPPISLAKRGQKKVQPQKLMKQTQKSQLVKKTGGNKNTQRTG